MSKYSIEKVRETIERMFAESGEEPSQINIRKEMGGGSFTTISETLTKWREERAALAEPLKIEMPEALIAANERNWNLAVSMADERLNKEREALESTRQELEKQQKANAEAIKVLEVENEEKDAELEKLAAELAENQKQTAKQAELLAAAQATIAEAQKSAESYKTMMQEAQAKAEAAQIEAATLRGRLEERESKK